MDKSKILEELKRINFITNYEVGDLVFENKLKKENILFEQKVNNLFEPKKRVINEEEKDFFKSMSNVVQKSINDATAQAKWARGTDPIGYWKILFESLTKAGVPVKWQVANDPVKSTYMYWGPWVINKLGDYNITLSTPKKNILYFKFRNNGGKYVGQQNLKDIQLDSECINLYFLASEVFKKDINQLLSYFYTNWQGHVRDTAGCLSKKSAIDGEMRSLVKTSVATSWETEMGNYIKKYLPADAKFVDGTSGKQITYGTTGLMLNFTKTGWIQFPENGDKNKVPINYGKWYWDEKTKAPIVNSSFASFMDVPSLIKDPYTRLIKPDLEKKKKDYEKQNKEIERKADLVYTNLVKAFDYDNDGVDDDWDGTDEDLTAKTIEMIDSREVLELLNKKIKARGYYSDITAWFKAEMDRISIDSNEYDRVVNKLNSLGYKLDKASWLGYLATYTVGSPIKAVDQTVTAIQNATNYANKQTTGAVAKYSEIQVKDMLKNQVSPGIDFIGQLLLNASRWYDDDEEIMEMAFARIHSKERYNQLKTLMGQDPYKYVKSLITNTGIVHSKEEKGKTKTPLSQTIDASYAVILGTPKTTNIQPKQAYEKYKKDLPFTSENPIGTNKKFAGEPLFWKIFEGKVKDPYLKDGKGVVPDGYFWGQNPSLYPIPEPYPTEDIQALRVFANQGAYRPLNEQTTNFGVKTQTDIFGNEALAKLRKMEVWNSELANQEKYIPKYCTAPNKIKERMDFKVQPTGSGDYGAVSESINKNSKIKFSEFILEDSKIIEEHSKKQILEVSGEGDEVQFKKTEGSTDTKLTGKEIVISMAAQCRDFGGLWVYGTQTGKPECFCRDKTNPLLSGKVGTNQNNKNVYINVAIDNSKTQTYTDWSNPDVINNATKTAISVISAISAIFIPVVGPYISITGALANFGIAASQGNTQEAALYLLFDLLPGVAAITIGPKVARAIVRKILSNGILNLKELKLVLTAINASEAISSKVGQKLSVAAKQGLIDQTTANVAKLLTKKVEGELVATIGADGITWKDLAKTSTKNIPVQKTLASI